MKNLVLWGALLVQLTLTGCPGITVGGGDSPGIPPPPGDASQIYVADDGNHRIVRINDMAGAG